MTSIATFGRDPLNSHDLNRPLRHPNLDIRHSRWFVMNLARSFAARALDALARRGEGHLSGLSFSRRRHRPAPAAPQGILNPWCLPTTTPALRNQILVEGRTA